MDNIYNGFTFVKALSLNNPKGTTDNNRQSESKIEEKPFLHAVVEFRTVHKTYDESFGFDWVRKKDNGLSNGMSYVPIKISGIKIGIISQGIRMEKLISIRKKLLIVFWICTKKFLLI